MVCVTKCKCKCIYTHIFSKICPFIHDNLDYTCILKNDRKFYPFDKKRYQQQNFNTFYYFYKISDILSVNNLYLKSNTNTRPSHKTFFIRHGDSKRVKGGGVSGSSKFCSLPKSVRFQKIIINIIRTQIRHNCILKFDLFRRNIIESHNRQ